MTQVGWKAGFVALAALLMAAAPVAAQDTLTSHIPFGFVAGRVTMPAGNYVITKADLSGLIQIKDDTGRHSAYILTVGTRADESQPELVFARVADRYVLLRIDDGTSVAEEIPVAPATIERAAERVALAIQR